MESNETVTEEAPTGDDGSRCCAPLRKCLPSQECSYFEEFKHMIQLGLGITIVQFCQSCIQPIAVIFCGHLGKVELDTVALSNSLINISGQWVVIGTATACDTLFSQAFGSKNPKLIGIQLQRALVIHCFILIPCIALHLNIERLLILMAQDPEVARLTGRYLTIFQPALLCMFVYEILRKYVQCQDIVLPLSIIGVVGLGVHILFQYIFVKVLEWGLDGSAIAQVLGYLVMISLTIGYIILSNMYKPTWDGWDLRLFEDWTEFTKLAIYGMLMICLEWWTFEVTIILSGIIGRTELGAQSVIFNVDQIFHLVPCQLSVVIAIRVGHYLGTGSPSGAKNVVLAGSIMACVSCVFVAMMCVLLRYQLPVIFTNQQDVIQMVGDVLPVVALFYLADSIGVVAKGIYRGAARQGVATIVNFIGFCLFALPLGVCLLFLTDLGIKGLWVGLGCGLWLQDIMFIGYIELRMDFKELSIEARQRVLEESTEEEKVEMSEKVSEQTPIIQKEGTSKPRFTTKKVLAFVVFGMILVSGIVCRVTLDHTGPYKASQETVVTNVGHNVTT